MSILDSKATAAEANAYKTFVMRVAQAVAGAHKEGGFLVVGGKRDRRGVTWAWFAVDEDLHNFAVAAV